MTESTADRVATVVLGAAIVGAAYYVLKTPSLRRLAWRLTATGLTVTLPAWLRREIEEAWTESGHRSLSASPDALFRKSS
jgi:hypothetical protein